MQLKYDEAAIRYHCQLLHHIAFRAGVDGKLILVGHGTAEDGLTKLPAVVHHFAIGNSDAMVSKAMAFEGTRYNVCTPWGIRPTDLARSRTGKTSEVLRLLALVTDSDADKGQSITPLTEPDYSVETSPGNFQHYFILDRTLENAEAKQYAIAFQRMYPKAEFANDITHDWRVPGTLNVTDKVKWDRGRSKCQPARIGKHWNSTFTDTGKLKAILHPHWEKPRPAQTVAQQKQYDNDPAKVEALFARLRDAGYFAAGPEARKRYVRATKALSCDLGDDVGREIWERVVCWQGERDDEGTFASQSELDERWKDCSSLPTGTQPITLGSIKRDVERDLGWPQRDMYTERERNVQQQFGSVLPALPAGSEPLIGAPTSPTSSTLPPGAVPMIGGPAPQPATPEYSETEIAERFSKDYASRVRYIDSRKSWVYWDGARWNSDETQYVKDLIRQHCRSESALAAITPKVTEAQARSIASEKAINAVFRLAGVDQNIASRAGDWDANPWLLGVPDGVVDLKTGTLREATPDDMVTKSTAVTPANNCPLWIAFLDQVTNRDVAMQAYLQRVAGYCLTADTREQALFFFDGPGGNGKGVFLNTLQGILGDYAKPTAIETLTASHGDRHPTEIADLLGARMVICTETERGKRWAESRIKQLTGGDRVSARFMGRDFFTFLPTFKLAISGNSKPSLRADAAMRRRFQVVPFHVTIPKESRDNDLPEKLKREWGGILAWAIAGCRAWQRDGLNPPASVIGATTDYMDEQSDDTLSIWIAECCDTSDPAAQTLMSELHTSYKAHALGAGEKDIMSAVKLGLALTELGYKVERTNVGRHRVGIKRKAPKDSGVAAATPALPPFPGNRVGVTPVTGVTG